MRSTWYYRIFKWCVSNVIAPFFAGPDGLLIKDNSAPPFNAFLGYCLRVGFRINHITIQPAALAKEEDIFWFLAFCSSFVIWKIPRFRSSIAACRSRSVQGQPFSLICPFYRLRVVIVVTSVLPVLASAGVDARFVFWSPSG